jgi:transcriptional regulator with XRE-family HTH domain
MAGRLEAAHDVAGSGHAVPMGSAWRDQSGGVRTSEMCDIPLSRTVDLSNLGTIIRERREALGLTQSGLAQLNGLARQTLVGLELGALSDLGSNRVAQVLAVLGLDLDPPSQAARSRKRGQWMAAKNASVSHVHAVPPDTLGHALVSGKTAMRWRRGPRLRGLAGAAGECSRVRSGVVDAGGRAASEPSHGKALCGSPVRQGRGTELRGPV